MPPLKVFLVEDSPILVRLIGELLTAEPGIEVVGKADTTKGAIELIRDSKPDVVVLDLHLREGTGLDVLRQLRQVGPPPVAIVLTNHSAEPYRKAALAGGANHFFDKSTEIPLMLKLVRTLRDQRKPGAAT
ncbi:MAG TPA: response regulator transcription factor [Casimicrobiaceae bacterium]|nr:response regulator transcription factor [Casimicrobiaceae bacterium]